MKKTSCLLCLIFCLIFSFIGCGKENGEGEINKFESVTVEVIGKISVPKEISVSDYDRVEFIVIITNNGKKDIAAVHGELDIQDTAGMSIKKLNCDLTQKTIKTGAVELYGNLGWEINNLLDEDLKIYNSHTNSLKFVYNINQVTYSN